MADTALKTADAGYLTRRLVDVSQDVIINEEDCGTLRGLTATAVKSNEEVVVSLFERILGRVSVHDVYHPLTGEIIVRAGQEICEDEATIIDESPIERVEIRSVLTCESKKVFVPSYGRNLSQVIWFRRVRPSAIAAQSIGEPGTQLTLHIPRGWYRYITTENSLYARYDGIAEFEELRTVLHN